MNSMKLEGEITELLDWYRGIFSDLYRFNAIDPLSPELVQVLFRLMGAFLMDKAERIGRLLEEDKPEGGEK